MSAKDQPGPLGATAIELYERLLRTGATTVAELDGGAGPDAAEVDRSLDQLVDLGLLDRAADGRLGVTPPRASVGSVVRRMEDSADWLQRQVGSWHRLWQEQGDTDPYIDVVTDEADLDAVDTGIVDAARHQVRGLQVGPMEPSVPGPPPELNPAFKDVIARGVEFRVVYGAGVVSDPRALALVQESIELGEQVRVLPEVPLRLTVCDDTYAVVTVAGRGAEQRHKIVVRPSGLLDALIDLFESYWRMSVPLAPRGPAEVSDLADDESRQLLAYLAAGLTDASIARELGVSERTVGRRVARLQERVGARSRFQLATQAARRGWI